MIRPTLASALAALFVAAAPLAAARLEVGSAAVDGRRIGAYEARWQQRVKQDDAWQDGPLLIERATLRRDGGRELLDHVQRTEGSGPKVVNCMIFDHATLEPLELVQSIEGGPPQAPTEIRFAFASEAIRGEAVLAEGTKAFEIETPGPMFYGMTFGLVLAALPLEMGYSAELPASMPQGRTTYTVKIEVVGKETVRAAGRTAEAWVVDTEWIDLDSGDVSPGGADSSGGAYYVLPDPPQGFPYVPKYVNDSVRIELIP